MNIKIGLTEKGHLYLKSNDRTFIYTVKLWVKVNNVKNDKAREASNTAFKNESELKESKFRSAKWILESID